MHARGLRGAAAPYAFAHLRKRAIDDASTTAPCEIGETEEVMRRELSREWSARDASEPSEIRVTSDAIIEVHGTGLLRHVTWEGVAEGASFRRIEQRGELAAPSAGDEYAGWVDRSAMRAQRIRVCRAIAAYALFAVAVAAAIYFLLW